MSKNYLFAIAFVVLALLLVFFLLLGPGPVPPVSTEPPPERSFSGSSLSPVVELLDSAPPSIPPAVTPSIQQSSAPADKESVMESMFEAAHSFSPEALPFLAKKLDHSDPEIREFAMESIKVLSDPAGIPVLKKAAERARTAQERKNLLEAAEWLALPDWEPPKAAN